MQGAQGGPHQVGGIFVSSAFNSAADKIVHIGSQTDLGMHHENSLLGQAAGLQALPAVAPEPHGRSGSLGRIINPRQCKKAVICSNLCRSSCDELTTEAITHLHPERSQEGIGCFFCLIVLRAARERCLTIPGYFFSRRAVAGTEFG
jgi:hypothetical protein